MQGKEQQVTFQAPTEASLNSMIKRWQREAKAQGLEDVRLLQRGRDPDGGWKATAEAHNVNWRGAWEKVRHPRGGDTTPEPTETGLSTHVEPDWTLEEENWDDYKSRLGEEVEEGEVVEGEYEEIDEEEERNRERARRRPGETEEEWRRRMRAERAGETLEESERRKRLEKEAKREEAWAEREEKWKEEYIRQKEKTAYEQSKSAERAAKLASRGKSRAQKLEESSDKYAKTLTRVATLGGPIKGQNLDLYTGKASRKTYLPQMHSITKPAEGMKELTGSGGVRAGFGGDILRTATMPSGAALRRATSLHAPRGTMQTPLSQATLKLPKPTIGKSPLQELVRGQVRKNSYKKATKGLVRKERLLK